MIRKVGGTLRAECWAETMGTSQVFLIEIHWAPKKGILCVGKPSSSVVVTHLQLKSDLGSPVCHFPPLRSWGSHLSSP